ncbi:regulatory iron-sulfur-containing complex subunit RicT [Enorma massiliensis]|uniref:regulatory iron-sulfur-containing complex subunit RicT n=1 Tax=Enorma massiliensis TaxID=1472761 RepID=UPI0002DAC7A4|nr:regulatory iron-sulfur-containing complex subunit RicT [Enorma massiliensis]
MPVVVPVKFPFASRDLWFDPQGLDIIEADYAICSTERGQEIGLVTADPFEVEESALRAPLKPVLRIATDADLDRADELARRGEEAMHGFRDLVKQDDLDMKPVGVEYLFGGEKAVFYFAAEDRVDFRQLVKDLSARFHTRVDMRQIGVRDETRLVGGIAHCGQELCCARFGGQFEPVSIRMAKEQDLPLNSAKISGVCGRLMCCLRYEFEAYKDFKGRAPKKKAVIDTPLGKARIQEYDTPREQLILRLESGKVFRVDLADMTCSDAAKKKSEEQGCACRPDCVTRSVLEKLESPDIALALMELDRENGLDVGDGLSSADRIVIDGGTSRRRRRGERGDGQAGQVSRGEKQGRGARSAKAAPSRRPGDGGQGAAGQAQSGSGQGGSRRRRRHLSSEERESAFLSAAARESHRDAGEASSESSGQGAGRTRRRHRSASAPRAEARGDAAKQTPQKPDVPSVASQVADGDVKVSRRRPGDGGGARRNGVAGQERPKADTARDGAADGEGQAPKKRRRRRPRKPKGSAPGSQPPASED